MTLPSAVTVLLDDGTGSFPYDVSKYVVFGDGFSYNRGRADWQGGVTAGVLNLTLNNSDGRFTPGSTLIASPSPIRVDQRIRVKETVNGTTFTRFTGYVKSWPVQWPATVGTIAFSSITAVDAQARAERHVMVTNIGEEILADSPSCYWPLDDLVGSTSARDASGNAHPMGLFGTGANPVFQTTTSPWSEVMPAATLAGGKYFLGLTGTTLTYTAGLVLTFATTATSVVICSWNFASNALSIASDGTLRISGIPVGTGAYNDGLLHTIGLRGAITGIDVYIDGALTNASVITADISALYLGTDNGYTGLSNFTGTFGPCALWAVSPSPARMASITGAFRSELTSARVSRLAYYANIPTGTLDAGQTTVPFQESLGTSTWDAINTVTDAEMGSAFVDENGTLEFHNRSKVSQKVTPDLSLVAHQYIAPDFTPTDDDQSILNYIETTSSVTGVTQVVRNTTSELGNGTATNPGHGRYSDSKTYLVFTDAEALDRANSIIGNFAEPTTRYGSLTVNLFAMPPAQAAAFLTALDLDMWLRVTSAPSQNTTGTTVDVVVEGFTETCKANEWYVTCNVVLRSLFNALILDNATYGVLDSSVARLGV